MGVQFTALDEASRAIVERVVALKERRGLAPGVVAPAPIATRPDGTPASTRAPTPVIPVPDPPALTPAPRMPAQADLSAEHRVEQVSAGPVRIETGLPAKPVPIAKPSRAIIGIDLGTTNSCAAIVKDGRPYVIPSREGYNTVPSIVALNARNRIVVGHLARAQLLTNPRSTVHGAKRLIGRAFETEVVQEMREKFAYEIVADGDGLAAVRLGTETLSLEQVAALVLREVKEVAQNHLQEEVNRAVITVPAYYNERQRAAVRQAGALAGLQVERILNEPTAAALAYAYGRHLNQRVLVYDLGGGTFDASVLELSDNVYEVVSTGGDTFLGGVDFDNRIVDRLLADWQADTGAPFDGDRVALSRLVDAAERAKCALSERAEFPVQLPYLALRDGKPQSLETVLTREAIVSLVEPLVNRTLEVCQEVLAAKSLATKDIDEVLLVGGQSRMPLVHEKVAKLFGRPPSHAVHPDEAVAIGAALLAHSLGSAEGVVLIDVLPMSIGIGLPGGRVKTIIERNTPLPARKQYGLATTRDGQTEFELVVLQGESAVAAECEYLGTLKLTGLPEGPRGMVKIAVTFELGAECLLTVTARELNSNRQVQAVMSAKEGPAAAQRKLAAANGEPQLQSQSFPVPAGGAAEKPGAARNGGRRNGGREGAAPGSALGGFLKRLFGRRDEAR
jgi:molecular chaperone DnaK